ncbi:MAG: acetyl-CoA C-acetyltransferase [Defluviitaleaceae bacterium]|nr:acetyl-CoA C-acetyltransferase [Defluviitaleaceae bacterium]MCL2273872.1 acetyl-CoA C-acetyltransferase [Defluviitaleaceae bacterium]
MRKVYIVAAKRTAIGSFLGTIKDLHPSEMGAAVVKNILEESKLAPDSVDEVIVGNILSAGLGQGIARQVSVRGGISHDVPAYAINHVCCSGMKVVMNAANAIQAGQAELILAGGVESMSGAPFILPGKVRGGNKLGDITALDHMVYDALTDAFENYHMGITAENVAEKYKITREAQDTYAIASQQKSIAAVDAGHFKNEIVPLTVRQGRNEVTFDTDEYPNRATGLEKLAALRPAFKKDGTVTAGNASGINDGASFMLIASEDAVKKHNLTPMAEIVGYAQAGIDPAIMGLGPVPAIKKALEVTGLSLNDMDLLELNEAFAAQALGVVQGLADEHSLSPEAIMEKTNVSGGAIGLGHPIGASGNRIMVTLVHGLKRTGKAYGLASLCAGGGMGTAVILKNVN